MRYGYVTPEAMDLFTILTTRSGLSEVITVMFEKGGLGYRRG